ncbi:uncharacterized protein FIBRA_07285 [Fibroporia radiculosa]|uniref:Cytochrome P450 n=1 Tax=Fibroporia radiculosa TaxID=599839 RepID=J4GE06_9APHY|nr:uncharacterized protein FIBRA_07285 [Fibroporia radiculosa]CCM05078.1 predicted protein [Fibroporia radiculosa]
MAPPGPNELSIVDISLLPSILGVDGMPKGPCKRGTGLKNAKGNLIGARDKQQHAEARRVWNRAFGSASIKTYEPIVIRHTAQLVDELKKNFDFMGDFAFGESFDLLQNGDKSGLVHMMEEGLYLPSLMQHIPWCSEAFVMFPFFGKQMRRLGEFSFHQVSKRLREGSIRDDLFYHLNAETQQDGAGPPPLSVTVSNSVTAIVAGSDTTASALSNALYYILSHPPCYARLQAEVNATFPIENGEPTDSAKLAQMEYLDAVIIFVPEGTAIHVPPFLYHRDPRYFSPDPDRFWPERWLSRADADVVLNTSAFIPFSMGPANCVGRPLALIEIRMVLAYMLQTFDIRFVSGFEPRVYEEQLQDLLVTRRGALPVTLTLRAGR